MEASSQTIELPEPRTTGSYSVEDSLRLRRSVREFSREPLSLAEVSQLLWAAQGITHPMGLRTAPSAGALYPLEVFLVAGTVTGLAAGIYRYRPREHRLETVSLDDARNQLARAALGQAPINKAPASLVFAAVYERTTRKYGKRGIRYAHMEVGHAAQNVFLQAVTLELNAVVIGAFYDEAVRRAVRMEPDEEPLYIMPIGKD